MSKVPIKLRPLSEVVETFDEQGREAFLTAYPHALLILDDVGQGGAEAQFQTIRVGGRPEDQPDGAGRTLTRVLGKLSGSSSKFVAPLSNESGKFACMLTVGRASDSDLRLNVPSLSKFHAYFTHVAREGTWYLADAKSSNGTFLNGAELPPSHGKVPLKSGFTIRFGPDVTALFYQSADFWELLHSSQAEAKGGEG